MRTEAVPAIPRPATPGRRRSQRGNAFIELSLVLLPLFALLFAIFDFSMVIFLKSTFLHAVREGTRYAVTYSLEPGMGHDASIKSIVQQNAMGFLSGNDGLSKIHIQYYDRQTLLPTESNAPQNLVEVSVEGYQWIWVAPLWRTSTPLTITARSADRMEALPPSAVLPAR